jgi:heparan-alpha-glucosaminide N-acetyltransferase
MAPSPLFQSTATSPSPFTQRVVSVDVLRGIVMLFLIPDLSGGFSFYQMADRYPSSAVWRWLGRQFSHVEWTGAATWDFVMPVFIFLVGVAIPLSYASREARGESHACALWHALVRGVALVLLGLLIQFKPQSRIDQLCPYLVLSLGLPVTAWMAQWLRIESPRGRMLLDGAWPVIVLGATAAWLLTHIVQLGSYDFNQILTQIGLAYFAAFLFVRQGIRAQALLALAILLAYSAAFVLYLPPPGAVPRGEILTGLFSHWNNGDNLAAGFDRWFINLLPRAQPYLGNDHGYHTLQFIPLIAVMLAGMIVGRRMIDSDDRAALSLRLIAAAAAAIVLGYLLSISLVPLVKSLYTPSWAVLSTGVALLLLALLYRLCDVRGHGKSGAWALPLIVLGANSVLLYVLAATERWRVVALWRRLTGPELFSVNWQPLLEALLVLLSFWLLAFVLYRLRILVRL